jgi:UDP-N-acetylglucosamine pyrophosphorylase
MELEKLCKTIREMRDYNEKLCLLENLESVQAQMVLPHYQEIYSKLGSKEQKCAFLSLLVLEEGSLFFTAQGTKSSVEIANELDKLVTVDRFYHDIGGLLGYVLQVKTLLRKSQKDLSNMEIRLPPSESIIDEGIFVKHASTFGLAHLDRVALIVTAGGLGARLGLVDDQEQPVPVASLPFMGRPLLEGIIRDLEGLEQLYFATYGHKIIIPMALMTSKEQKNEENIRALLKKHDYFGRPLSSIRIFSQISVPVLTIEGNFATPEPGKFLFHPSGHGALWKTAEETGIFRWLKEKRIEHLLLRQINNPLAALDHNLLAFLGLAIRQRKSFGFFVCERLQGAAEGALVHVHEKTKHYITNIEYSELQLQEGLANTNILYANLEQVREKLKTRSLFGPLLNMKSEVPHCLPCGTKQRIRGGRLESMMQNISEEMSAKKGEPLPTLVVKNRRKKTISAIKREYDPEQGPLETVEAACYSLLENNYELLARCTVEPLPSFFSLEEFLEKGPSIFFCYHPILGPLYEVIEKKLHAHSIAFGSMLQLEIANFRSHNLQLRGSLLIEGTGGRCVLNNVKVNNLGIDRVKTVSYCKGEIVQQESCRILIGEGGEILVENVTFSGDQWIEVPPETRLIVRQDTYGNLLYEKSFCHS